MLDKDRVKAFYAFMVERESIRLRRLAGLPAPWTQDPILQTYSFTNVKREYDRTTMEFKKIYDHNYRSAGQHRSLFINCALYRYFGTVNSAKRIGWIAEWTEHERARIIDLGDDGVLTFTAAYIVSSGGRSEPKHYVVADTIDALWNAAPQILDQDHWRDAIKLMSNCYGVGSFMAKEVYLDYLLATGYKPTDWETYTPVGPGGQRGANRIKHGWADKMPEWEALEVIREVYGMREEFWPKLITTHDSDLVKAADETPTLDLTDIQFQFCEFDKYSRVAEGRRPKRNFKPTVDAITCRK